MDSPLGRASLHGIEAIARLEPRSGSWWLFAIVAAGAIALLVHLYRRDRKAIGRRRGWLLTGLRAVLILLVAAFAFDLASSRTVVVERLPEVVVVVDDSKSMSLDDPYRPVEATAQIAASLGADPSALRGLSRYELSRRALESPWGDELRRRSRVTLVTLSELVRDPNAAVHPSGSPGGAGSASGDADALGASSGSVRSEIPDAGARFPSTTLLSSFPEVATRRAGGNFGGFILFSDGRHNTGRDPHEIAGELRTLDAPVLAIGVGAETSPRDLRIESIDAPPRVFANDPIELDVALVANGFPGARTRLEARSGGERLATADAALPDGGGESRISIIVEGLEPGVHAIEVAALPLEGEHTEANNRVRVFVEVLEATARVLLLDGGPRPEWRRLRKLFTDDPTVEVTSMLVEPLPDPHLPREFPTEISALLEYDVLVVGDVSPDLFGAAGQSLLRDFVVEHGRAIVLIAGDRHLPWSWHGTPLEEILPIEIPDPLPPADLGAALARDAPRLRLTAEGATSQIARLLPGRSTNAELWSLLPGPDWVAPTTGARPGTTVLVEVEATARGIGSAFDGRGASGARLPVFATRPAGAGNVFWAGIDSTWRWSFQVGNVLIEDFWRRVFRWCVTERLEPRGGSDLRLAADGTLHREGDDLRLRALVKSDATRDDAARADEGEPGSELDRGAESKRSSWVMAELRAVDDKPANAFEEADASGAENNENTENTVSATRAPSPLRVRLDPIPESDGRYETIVSAREIERWLAPFARAGVEEVECEATLHAEASARSGDEQERGTIVRFTIALRPRDELLDLTRDDALLDDVARISGGGFAGIEELPRALDLLPGAPAKVEETHVRALVDSPLLIALAASALLIAEWILRKRWSLV
ncbi:MAG TPA: hypothetical protein VK116_00530 [Planctomycetota bacterium]|nr:hypothetical protein [Planctomycetota bacterium]